MNATHKIKFYCRVDESKVSCMVEEAVREMCRRYSDLRRGSTQHWNAIVGKVQALVRYGVEFLRTGRNGVACYHYDSELIAAGYGELAWGGGVLATLFAAAWQGNVAQASCSGQALYAYGTEATAEARKAYAAICSLSAATARARHVPPLAVLTERF